MKSKDPTIRDISEMLDEIQAYLDSESGKKTFGSTTDIECPETARLSDANSANRPQTLELTQFFLSRHGESHEELLKSLPEEMFIIC